MHMCTRDVNDFCVVSQILSSATDKKFSGDLSSDECYGLLYGVVVMASIDSVLIAVAMNSVLNVQF